MHSCVNVACAHSHTSTTVAIKAVTFSCPPGYSSKERDLSYNVARVSTCVSALTSEATKAA